MVSRRVEAWVFFARVFRQLSSVWGEQASFGDVHSWRHRRRFSVCSLCFFGGVYPGLDHVAIVLEPVPDALLRILRAGLIDICLHLVDLILVERDGLEERVGDGV